MQTAQVATPWELDEHDFPAGGDSEEQLRFLVRYAVLAPSSHNTQPWIFQVRNGSLELHADESRGLRVIDPNARELVISCGAALYHLRIAMKHFGHRPVVELLPSDTDADVLARLRVGKPTALTPWERAMFRAIPSRRTNRKSFESFKISSAILADLQELAAAESAWLHEVNGEFARGAVVDLIAEGDRIQFADPAFRRELATWMRPNDPEVVDGIPGYGMGVGNLAAKLGPIVVRSFDVGRGQALKDRRLASGAPVLAVLGTRTDDRAEWLAAGQALAAVLLLARANGLWASFLNQPIEVPELRSKLADLLSIEGVPQMLFRMGYASEVPPTPRRSAERVLQ